MNETAVVRRGGAEGWRGALWVVGAAIGASGLAMAVFMVGIGVAEISASAFGLTERLGVPVFAVIITVTAIAYAASLHLIVRALGTSAEVPWTIWPAMAAPPAAWVFIVLASGSTVMEPILSVMQLLGIAVAFVTLGERRWTRG